MIFRRHRSFPQHLIPSLPPSPELHLSTKMSDTVTITLDPACEEGFGEDYRQHYEADFTRWMNLHRTWTMEVGHGSNRRQETFVFDEALIM